MSNLEYQPAETLTVQLLRPDQGVSWGFRLQGGVDFSTPLSIQSVGVSFIITQVFSLKRTFPNLLKHCNVTRIQCKYLKITTALETKINIRRTFNFFFWKNFRDRMLNDAPYAIYGLLLGENESRYC